METNCCSFYSNCISIICIHTYFKYDYYRECIYIYISSTIYFNYDFYYNIVYIKPFYTIFCAKNRIWTNFSYSFYSIYFIYYLFIFYSILPILFYFIYFIFYSFLFHFIYLFIYLFFWRGVGGSLCPPPLNPPLQSCLPWWETSMPFCSVPVTHRVSRIWI